MWVINIQHWLDETKSGPAVPQLKAKIKKLTEIITYATSECAGLPTPSVPKCWRRPGRKPCDGILDIFFHPETDDIYWHGETCRDSGLVSGWQGLIWDMSDTQTMVNL